MRQEITVAKEAHLFCGRDFIRWDTLVLADQMLTSPELVSEFDRVVTLVSSRQSGIHWVRAMEMFREEYASRCQIDLRDLLLHAKGADVTDPRDRVYGVLSLADARDRVEVDYKISPTQVFTRAMVALFEHSQNLDGLDGCSLSARETENLPSWVIDLNADFNAMVLRSTEGGEALYNAAGNQSAGFQADCSNALLVRGFAFDTIEQVAGSLYEDTEKFQNMPGHDVGYWLELARSFLRRRDPRISDDAVMDIFCRLLVADSDDVGNRATPNLWQHVLDNETFETLPNKIREVFEHEEPYFSARMAQVIESRVMLATSKGYIGLGDMACKEGDIVCILFGAGVPFVLRPEQAHYLLVGESCKLESSVRCNSVLTC